MRNFKLRSAVALRRWVLFLAALAAALLMVSAFARAIVEALGYSPTDENLAAWGESFGGVNALMATAAFFAIAYTAWLQHQTLVAQQEQIRETAQDQHRQRFESQYLALLSLLREVRNDVRFAHSEEYISHLNVDEHDKEEDVVEYKGLDAFREAWVETDWFVAKDTSPEVIGNIYTRWIHRRYEANLGPYFRIVYTMLKMVKTDAILSEAEKARFGNLLRSQLTSYELVLHGLNGLSEVSADFGKLITEFHLLKYLPDDGRRAMMMRCYQPEAFASRHEHHSASPASAARP